MEKLPVLILCPHPEERGGVADYYRLVGKYFRSDRVDLSFYYTGNRTAGPLSNNRVLKFGKDLCSLLSIMGSSRLVVLNPSLDPRAVVRDGIYHFLAKRIYRKKTLVFFHGWDPEFEKTIARRGSGLFRTFFNFDRGVLLAHQFKNTLVNWGYPSDAITVETTIYESYDHPGEKDYSRIVFLARFEPNKGCLEAIKAVEIAARKFPQIRLFMVGDGSLTPELRNYVQEQKLRDNVIFTGWLEGEEKHRLVSSCGIMLYPTCYGEGMPICLLEGMGLGLVVITRPVAGIRDIIDDGRNGFLVESTAPEEFADRLQRILADPRVGMRVSQTGRKEAELRFEIRSVARRLEQLYFETGQ